MAAAAGLLVPPADADGHRAAPLLLHGYFRSTASWRVRIALLIKGVAFDQVAWHLRRGEHRSADFLRRNPQGLVPALDIEGEGAPLTQSLAIIEWLEETRPEPALLPGNPLRRARVRAFSQAIACDIHPAQNLTVLQRLKALGLNGDAVNRWAADTIGPGLLACERLVADEPGPFCFGGAPTLADLCLVPQLHNARRFGCDLASLPRLLAAERACAALPAFAAAAPDRQPDAE